MGNSTFDAKIIYSRLIEESLLPFIRNYPAGKVFLITEETVDQIWVSQLDDFFATNQVRKITIPAGEQNKKIEAVVKIWKFLSKTGADRKSLIINVGGGMLTDLAGFAATTFKRGIDFLNVPTTLLAQVDASVGGKTGFNLSGYKNEIGTFKEPVAVIFSKNHRWRKFQIGVCRNDKTRFDS